MASSSSSRERVSEIDEIQSEVDAMAAQIVEYRTTLPELLKFRFASLLEAHRPVLNIPDPGPSSAIVAGKVGAINNAVVERDNETAEKISLLKQKMSSNATAMPIILKRMKDCIARIDKLDECNFNIHPVFKRKRTD